MHNTYKMTKDSNVVLTTHAMQRKKQRNINIVIEDGEYYINNNKITLEYISKLPYVRDNGCFKYYDFKNLVSWYVRGTNIVTIVQYEKIAIIRRIITDVYHLKFNDYCRDHTFGTCNRGCKCKFKHIDLNMLYSYQNPNTEN